MEEELLNKYDGGLVNDEAGQELEDAKKQAVEDGDAVTTEYLREQDEKEIHNLVLAAQTAMSRLNNKMDAYSRTYNDIDSTCKIALWSKGVQNTVAKSVKDSKDNIFKLIPTGVDHISHVVGGYSYEASITPGGITLDTAKLKRLDPIVYDKLCDVYPKKKASSKRLVMKPLKGGGE